jgi:hypothetical protein
VHVTGNEEEVQKKIQGGVEVYQALAMNSLDSGGTAASRSSSLAAIG